MLVGQALSVTVICVLFPLVRVVVSRDVGWIDVFLNNLLRLLLFLLLHARGFLIPINLLLPQFFQFACKRIVAYQGEWHLF